MSDYQVLVVEDDADVRLGCLQALSLEGLQALGVESVEKVPRAMLKDFPGVVVACLELTAWPSCANWSPRTRTCR